jgi:hypothetical protein
LALLIPQQHLPPGIRCSAENFATKAFSSASSIGFRPDGVVGGGVAVAGVAAVVALDVAAVATPESTALETTPLETTPLDPALLPHPAVTNRSAAPMTPTAPARRLGTARPRLDRPTGSM